jgi:hypothetical protein
LIFANAALALRDLFLIDFEFSIDFGVGRSRAAW